MTDYGQAIPPRWYQSTTAQQVTKMNLAHQLHRALMQVGMIPIRAWNPFDLELPANAEYNFGTSFGGVFYYDYPTSETFVINGVAYRPVLVMVPFGRSDGSALGSDRSHWFCFEHGYRRADRLVRDDFANLQRLHNSTTNFGHGAFNVGMAIGSDLSYYESTGLGAAYQFSAWKPYAASVDANRNQLQGVRNIHVILGKGGLLVQVGTGIGKTDSGDILSFLVAFGGARIPGRARIPANDTNLNRINPTFVLPLRHSSEAPRALYYSTSTAFEDVTLTGVRLSSVALGCQHDLAVAFATQTGFTTRPGAVHLQIFNLENIERPFWPSLRNDTLNSPRDHPSGAAHILQPLVYVQDYRIGGNDYYQVQDFNVRSQIAPTWFDIWMCPKVRFGDRTAPAGEYVDPVTGTNWWLFRAEGINAMMAVEVEGITKFSTLGYFDTFTLTDTDYFNLNGGFSWTAGNPQQASASQTQGASMTQNWTATPATDEATAIHSQTSGASTWTFVAEPYSVPSDTTFSLQIELRWYSVSAQAGGTNNPLHIEWSTDDGTSWTTLQTIYNQGTNTGNPFHAYTATAEFPVYPGTTDGKIRFRLRTVYDNNSGGLRTAAVRNIRIRQYNRV